MLNRFKDIDHLLNAQKSVIVLSIIFSIVLFIGVTIDDPNDKFNLIIIPLLILYIFIIRYLTISPVSPYAHWIAENGLFPQKQEKQDTAIVGRDNLSTYSVAGELIKWAKLYEDGHITKEEYESAKRKILKADE